MDTEFQGCLWVKMIFQEITEKNYMMHDGLAYIFTFVFTISCLCPETTVQIRIFDSCKTILEGNSFFQCTSVPSSCFHSFQSQEIIKFCRIADYM